MKSLQPWQLLLIIPAAIDSATIGVWTRSGLTSLYLLSVMEVASRPVCFAGRTNNPNDRWMGQVERNLTDLDEFLA